MSLPLLCLRSYKSDFVLFFPTEVCWYLAPFCRFPFAYWCLYHMCPQPELSASDDAEQLFCLCRAGQLCLASLVVHPQDSVVGVAIYHPVGYSMLLHQRECMDYSKKLADVVGAIYWAEVKHRCSCLQVDGLIFHRAGIARACCVHCPSFCFHLHRKRQDSIVAVRRRIFRLFLHRAILQDVNNYGPLR